MNTNSNNEQFENPEDFASELSKIKRQNPFSVPEGYFDTLPQLIQERVQESSRSNVFLEKLMTLFQLKFAVPALTMAVIALVVYINTYKQPTVKPVVAATQQVIPSVSDSTIIASLQDDISDLDASSLIEAVASVPETQQSSTDSISTTDDQIVNYLVNHDIDESTIVNQL